MRIDVQLVAVGAGDGGGDGAWFATVIDGIERVLFMPLTADQCVELAPRLYDSLKLAIETSDGDER